MFLGRGCDAQGRRIGRSRNYLEVVAANGDDVLRNTVSQVKLKGFVEDGRMLGIIKS